MTASIVNRNNVLAGCFVLASLVLAVAIAAVLGDFLGGLGEKNEFVARFPTSVGVTGLQPGAEVTFAGLAVGQVVSVNPYLPAGPEAPPAGMDVVIAVDTRIRLFEDAFADLSPPILGGVSRINFASPGQGRLGPDARLAELATNDNNGVLDPGEAVRGRFAPSILAQLGFTVEDAEKIRNTIADVEAISATARETAARVDRMAASIEPKVESVVADANASVANVRAFTDRLGAAGDWGGRIDSILASADAAAAETPLVVADVRTAIASARGLLDTHSASLARVLGNVEATTERVRFETVDQAETLLREGTLAAASFRAVGEDAGAIVANARPEIGVTLANTRSISQQARLFLDEIRAQPWRLLKQPGREDLMREPLYAAARTYADAVADLRAASEALDAAVQGRGPDAARPGDTAMEVARVAQAVQAAYDRYAVAERALLEHLRESAP
jgi:ABC-type transporter Mla subunit MlaD